MADLVIGDYTAAVTVDGSTNYLLIQPGSSSTAYRKINRDTFLGVSGQPADISTIQSLTNKTLDNTNTATFKDTLFTLQDDGDVTKQARFQLSGITTATLRTYTLPNASSTLADIATAQTLTNKTLTSPTVNGGTIDNSTITVDAIGEHTAANGVTIDGLNIKDGALNTNNSVVTANITDAAVTPAKLLAGTGSGWTWQSFTPTWSNLTVGNGTNTGAYIQIGKTVIFEVKVLFGTTTAMGTSPSMTLPVTTTSFFSAATGWIGAANILDSGTANFQGIARFFSTTTATIHVTGVGGTYANDATISSTAPMTWAVNDQLTIVGYYQAA